MARIYSHGLLLVPTEEGPPTVAEAVGAADLVSASSVKGFVLRTAVPTIAATVPLPAVAGELVGFRLQNTSGSASAAQWVRFAQQFAEGELTPGQHLEAVVGGSPVPVQIDVLQRHEDDAVKMALLAFSQGAVAGNGAATGMLRRTVTSPGADLPVNQAILSSYNLAIGFTTTAPVATTFTVDAAALLTAAISGNAHKVLRRGPHCVEVRVETDIVRALRVVLDISAFSDGTTRTIVQFNNDRTFDTGWTLAGGAVTYTSISVTQGGATKFSRATPLTQYQYQNWHIEVSHGASATPTLHQVHDIDYRIRQGTFPSFDLVSDAHSEALTRQAQVKAADPAAISSVLGVVDVRKGMPGTGSAPDIGITTEANTLWLINQTPATREFGVGQGWTAGTVPWNTHDITHKHPVQVNERGNYCFYDHGSGYVQPTQLATQFMAPPLSDGSGWELDSAHTPELAYPSWMLTGERVFLDRVVATAAFQQTAEWPETRHGTEVIMLNERSQTRAQGWMLRGQLRAWQSLPDAMTVEKAWYKDVIDGSFAYILGRLPTLVTEQGEIHTLLDHSVVPGSRLWLPYHMDFVAEVVAECARAGIPGAKAFLRSHANWACGRFLQDPEVFPPQRGYNYIINLKRNVGSYGFEEADWMQTYAEVYAGLLADGATEPETYLTRPAGYFAQHAWAAVAGVANVFCGGTSAADHKLAARALRAYGWLWHDRDPNLVDEAQGILTLRLPDTYAVPTARLHLVTGTGTKAFLSERNTLIFNEGVGGATLQASAGSSVLIDGSTNGGDTLVGGASDDYLLGGKGANTFQPGSGRTVCDILDAYGVRGGVATIEADPAVAGIAEVIGFRPGTDKIKLMGAASGTASSLLASASDTDDGVVLTLNVDRSVRINDTTASQLTTADFLDADAGGAQTGSATDASSAADVRNAVAVAARSVTDASTPVATATDGSDLAPQVWWQSVNLGAGIGAPGAESRYSAFQKCNANFAALFGPSPQAVVPAGQTLTVLPSHHRATVVLAGAGATIAFGAGALGDGFLLKIINDTGSPWTLSGAVSGGTVRFDASGHTAIATGGSGHLETYTHSSTRYVHVSGTTA